MTATASSAPIRVDAVLTDLDGVLADSTAVVERAWRQWADQVGVDWPTLAADLHGVRAVETIARVVPHRDALEEAARLEEYELALVGRTLPVAGAAALLAALPFDRWAVVTSGSRVIATARLTTVGHRLPRVLVSADDVTIGKPNPQPYLAAATALGVSPTRCLVVEDAPAGVVAGRAAGALVVGVATSHDPGELRDAGAHVVVPDPGHLDVEVDPSTGALTVRPMAG